MGITPSAFGRPPLVIFHPFYAVRVALQRGGVVVAPVFRRFVAGVAAVEPVWEDYVVRPVGRAVQYVGREAQFLQMGNIRVYCLYIIVALAVLLVLAVR
jgi:hydrogenase-4 component B